MLAIDSNWVPLSTAAKRVGVSQSKLSRMVKLGQIESRKNPRDERQTLVNIVELQRRFNPPT